MEQGPIELGSGLVGGQGGQAAKSDLTGREVAAIRLCLLGFGSLCATLAAEGLFTLELNKIEKMKTRKNKSSPSPQFSPPGCSTSSRSRWAIASCLFRSASGVHARGSGLLVSSVSLGV